MYKDCDPDVEDLSQDHDKRNSKGFDQLKNGPKTLGETKYLMNNKDKKEQNNFTSSVITTSVGGDVLKKNEDGVNDVNKKKKNSPNLKNSKLLKNQNLKKSDINIEIKQDFHILNPRRPNSCFFCLKAEPKFFIPACTSWQPLPLEVYILIFMFIIIFVYVQI